MSTLVLLTGGYLYDYYGAVRLFELSAFMAMGSLALSVFACIHCSNSIGNDITKSGGSATKDGQKANGDKSGGGSAYSNVPSEEDL